MASGFLQGLLRPAPQSTVRLLSNPSVNFGLLWSLGTWNMDTEFCNLVIEMSTPLVSIIISPAKAPRHQNDRPP